jgi:hypothetical protein
MENKKASESLIIMTELVLPNDTNLFGNLMAAVDFLNLHEAQKSLQILRSLKRLTPPGVSP